MIDIYPCIFCGKESKISSSSYTSYICEDSNHRYFLNLSQYKYTDGSCDISEEVLVIYSYIINYQYTGFMSPRTIRRLYITGQDFPFKFEMPEMTYENKPIFQSVEDIENFLLIS